MLTKKMKRKICVVSTTRADYGLLFWLLKEIENSRILTLDLVVSGAHLEERFGLTYKEIERDFKDFARIPLGLENDDEQSICAAFGRGVSEFGKYFSANKPDILVLLGDRYEMMAAGVAAMIHRVVIAHIHGGETSQGAIDESIRHSLTKMSQIHFPATSAYKRRIIQLGENPRFVYNVGGMGIENIKRLNLLGREDFENSIKFKLNKRNILVTFHPVTLEANSAREQFKEILSALESLKNTHLIFTGANADSGGKIINEMIADFVSKNSKRAVFVLSLGQLRYLSALKHCDIVLGNSSSGLAEAPSFKIATINVGDRQKGRLKASSVIDAKPLKKDILKAIKKAQSAEFSKILKRTKNPYGNGKASKKIVRILQNVNLDGILKKEFYDIKALKWKK